MNLYALLLIGCTWAASVAGAGWWAYGAGQDAEIATQAREDKVAENAARIAADVSAAAIAKIKPQITTIKQETEREIRTNTIYADCRHSPEQLQRLNAALTGGGSEPAGGGQLPRADAAGGPELRRDDGQAGGGGGAVPGVP